MSVKHEITISTVLSELEEAKESASRYGWSISELDENNIRFTVKMQSPIDKEIYVIEFQLDNYPEWPPAIEFIHPSTNARGVKSAYPSNKKYGGFFHTKPCICNPCSRLAYKDFKSLHPTWDMSGWKNNPKVGSLTRIVSILEAIYFRINNKEIYNGRMG
ncbi:MAG: hypothetical protein R2764_23820 [Bacteroidales bacterium]